MMINCWSEVAVKVEGTVVDRKEGAVKQENT